MNNELDTLDSQIESIARVGISASGDFENKVITGLAAKSKNVVNGVTVIYSLISLLIIFTILTGTLKIENSDSSDQYKIYRAQYIKYVANSYSYQEYSE